MSIEPSIVKSLNSWGEHHTLLVHALSNDLVYVVLLLSLTWIVYRFLKLRISAGGWGHWIVTSSIKALVIVVIPVGIATAISELISVVYVRQRPFVAVPDVKLLVPHSADGGMPSHHIVFMCALVAIFYYYDRKFAVLLGILTLLTGFARVVAGIHYPSDIIVGALLGVGIVWIYRLVVVKIVPQKLLSLS